MRRYRVTFEVDLTVHDDFAITRVTENVDGWREQMYDLDEDQTAEMLARMMAFHHRGLSGIDGWADMSDSAAEVSDPRGVDVERLL